VALSRRLRRALALLYRSRFEPGPDVSIFGGIDPGNFRSREWWRILERAGIGHRALKDLRDTFASQLLTAGVQLGYVSQQLGHADVAITARHYARWAGGDTYREPMELERGEVPADLLARLCKDEQKWAGASEARVSQDRTH
jgi:integrase